MNTIEIIFYIGLLLVSITLLVIQSRKLIRLWRLTKIADRLLDDFEAILYRRMIEPVAAQRTLNEIKAAIEKRDCDRLVFIEKALHGKMERVDKGLLKPEEENA